MLSRGRLRSRVLVAHATSLVTQISEATSRTHKDATYPPYRVSVCWHELATPLDLVPALAGNWATLQ